MRYTWIWWSLVGLLSIGAAAAEGDTGLAAQAKVTRNAATATALARVPNGTVQSSELEKEHGKLIWSFDIQQPDSRDVIEVQVDATTGRIIATSRETAADQEREAAADKH
jgi:uncharacterized membrane protein YkoI